jgi:DNA-binding transcriptional ArsR family regulator
MADIFDVIADQTRRDLMAVLLARFATPGATGGEISVGDIVEKMRLSQPTVSKHLRVLREHGLVTVREDGQHRYYRLESGPLFEIEDWLLHYLDANINAEEADPFAAWSGAEMGASVGRKIAESSHQARAAIEDVSEKVSQRLPKIFTRRPFRRR